jgi:4-amino-4-deoxy-L-arabinose transferase-like glycosyltransferase
VLIGRYVTMDASLTCSILILSFALMLAFKDRLKQKWLIIAGLAAGVGFLIKGPVVLVLGLPPVLTASWLARNRSFSRPRNWLWFTIPFTIVAAPWFLATAIVHPEFIEYFFWKHHVVRFSDAFNHREPFWYFAPAALIMMFPASYLLPSLIKFVSSRSESNRNLRSTNHGFLLLFAAWIIGFFSLSESKLPTYILPALPPLCLLMGVLLDKKIISPVHSGWVKSLATHRKSFLESLPQRNPIELLCLLVAIFYTVQIVFKTDVPWPLVVSATILTAALVIVSRRPQTPRLAAWSCFGLLAFCFVIAGVNHLAPLIAESRSVHSAAQYLRSTSEFHNAPVVFFGREKHGASLTLPPNQVRFFESDEADSVCRFLEQHPSSIIVSSDKQMQNLRRMLDWTIVIETDETARHLYHTKPNPILNAKATQDPKILVR